MNKRTKHLLFLIISIMMLIVGFSNEIYAGYEGNEFINAFPYLTQHQNGWYCLQHHLSMANGAREREKWSFSYRSDSANQFERAMAYIIRDAQNSGDNGWRNRWISSKSCMGINV